MPTQNNISQFGALRDEQGLHVVAHVLEAVLIAVPSPNEVVTSGGWRVLGQLLNNVGVPGTELVHAELGFNHDWPR